MTPYNPETHAGGRLVQDPTTGKYRVEWFEKEASPFNPLPIRFQKDDGGEAVSGTKQSKDSLKRAKKDRKNRLKAEAAAETNRENLNKGDEMKDPIRQIAKAMVERDYTPRTTTKLAFWKALTALAEKKRQPGQSREQSFAKAITTGDGETLYRAYRMCKNGSEPTSWSGDDEPDADDVPETSSAYDTMAAKARKLAGKLGITFEQAFARVYSENRDLAKIDRMHHFAKVARYGGC